VIQAPREEVWNVVSDPHHLPRWWPRAVRVEDVRGDPGSRRAQWTLVLGTAQGRSVRADFRSISAASGERFVWQQLLEGSPFERIVRSAEAGVELADEGPATEVTVYTDERLRGLSRLGATMMRGAARRRLDEALDGLERALVG
jgi:carbon monoxide dehydrogenase subunit G